MIKRLLLVLLMSNIGMVFAQNTTTSDTATQEPKVQQQLNSPTAGSKQYSNGNFGEPKITGKKGQSYYTDKQINNADNKADVTGSTSYSSRSTAETKLTGKKGNKYYTQEQLSNGPNQPTQGSRIGSNQVFDYPGTKTNTNVSNNVNSNNSDSTR